MKGGKAIDFLVSLPSYVSIIFLLAAPTFAFPVSESKRGTDDVSYSVLLDAGSSSTKLKVYSWSPPDSSTSVPRVRLVHNERFKPGLSEYENNPKGLRLYIRKILKAAKAQVPRKRHSETPISVMATAGLRFLEANSATKLLDVTKSVLRKTKWSPFKYKRSRVSVLSGEEEGVYAWIAANYLLGFFDSQKPTEESVGVLEMGGGSTQIAFIPRGPLFAEEFHVTMAKTEYQLYVQSYLQYGSSAIKLKLAHLLAKGGDQTGEVDNPCILKGETRKTQLESGKEVLEKGTGSPDQCLELLQEILKPHTGINCQPKPCAIGGVYQPSISDMTFYATQSYEYAPKSLKAIGPDGTLDIDKLEKEASKHCTRTLKEAVAAGFNEKFASDDCLAGLYIPTLLTLSYGFSRDTTNIKVISKIGEESIDWALGATLIQLSKSN